MKLANQLDFLFKDVVAIREGAWAPSMGFVLNNGEDGSSKKRDYDDNNINGYEENFNNDLHNLDWLENINIDIP